MEFKVDFLEQIRKTIDWIKANILQVGTVVEKRKFNEIINSISDLVINKKSYLIKLKQASGSKEQLFTELQKALKTAKKDTKTLVECIKETGLNTTEFGTNLNLKLKSLANQKILEIEHLNPETDDNNKIIDTLTKYEAQWIEIANDLEKLKNEIKKV